MNTILTLKINETDSLLLMSEETIDEVDLFASIFKFYLKTRKGLRKIHNFAVGQELYDFIAHIQNCLDNKYKISEILDFKVDLGFLWNEYYQKFTTSYESGKNIRGESWSGESLIWFFNHADGNNSCMTFLYNDDHGNIVLEVASEYPWFYEEKTSEIAYKDWLPEYKILYKTIIPKNIAIKWVQQMLIFRDMLDVKMTCCKRK